MSSLRDRKRARTRDQLIAAATDLFGRRGYEKTTIADIAAAAEVSPRTFFAYFATKEDVLFADGDARVRAALAAIENRAPDESPAEILLHALRDISAVDDDLTGPTAALRLRLIREVPAVRGRALQLQQDGQLQIAHRLHQAFPDRLDEVEAGALVGAFVGAVGGALQALLAGGPVADAGSAALRDRLNRAISVALRPWT